MNKWVTEDWEFELTAIDGKPLPNNPRPKEK